MKAQFTSREAGEWCRAAVYNAEEAKLWKGFGADASMAKRWRDNGFYAPEIVRDWHQVGVGTPEDARQWKDAGFTPYEAAKEMERLAKLSF
jgi:hypothetical protein